MGILVWIALAYAKELMFLVYLRVMVFLIFLKVVVSVVHCHSAFLALSRWYTLTCPKDLLLIDTITENDVSESKRFRRSGKFKEESLIARATGLLFVATMQQ